MVIIDGHHRYFTLKKLGFKKIPVTKLDYQSIKIKTNITEAFTKQE
jgi:ParB-like chromosome segregation protein Spo0J